MPTVRELAQPKTVEELVEQALQSMDDKGLLTRGLGPLHPTRVQTELDSEVLVLLYDLLVLAIEGGFPGTAASTDASVRNPWLDLAIAGIFQEPRNPSRAAVIQLNLKATLGNGPFTLNPGRIAVFGPSLTEPLYYRSIQSANVPANNGTDGVDGIPVRFRAERDGAAYNVPPNTITQLKTPVPGLVVTSPAIGTTGSIVIDAGQDEETDQAYFARAVLKWASLGRGWMDETIRYLILKNFPTVTRIAVRDPGGLPATVDVYIGDGDGGLDDDTVQAVYDFLASKLRRPSGNRPIRVFSATTLTVPFTLTLYTDGTNSAAAAEALLRLTAFKHTLQLGQRVYRSRLQEEAIDVGSGTFAADIDLTEDIEPSFSDAVLFNPTIIIVERPEDA